MNTTYVVAVSFPGVNVPGFIYAPAFDSWTREYGSYHGALTAAVQLVDLYAGHATLTIVQVTPEPVVAPCDECGVPLRVVGRANDYVHAAHVCIDCASADEASTSEVPWWREPTPEPNY